MVWYCRGRVSALCTWRKQTTWTGIRTFNKNRPKWVDMEKTNRSSISLANGCFHLGGILLYCRNVPKVRVQKFIDTFSYRSWPRILECRFWCLEWFLMLKARRCLRPFPRSSQLLCLHFFADLKNGGLRSLILNEVFPGPFGGCACCKSAVDLSSLKAFG